MMKEADKMAIKLYNASWVKSALAGMAESISNEKFLDKGLALIGIQTRGAEIADRLAALLQDKGISAEVGYLDPTMFRDDLHTGAGLKGLKETAINFDIEGKAVILIDDVILTGRSVRAAIDGLLHYGRPACVRLYILVDRGGREIPIQPDVTGAHIDVPQGSWIRIKLEATDQRDDAVYIIEDGENEP